MRNDFSILKRQPQDSQLMQFELILPPKAFSKVYFFFGTFRERSNIAIFAASRNLWLSETSNFVFGSSCTWVHLPEDGENWMSIKKNRIYSLTFFDLNSFKVCITLFTLEFYDTDVICSNWRPGKQWRIWSSCLFYSKECQWVIKRL